MSIETLTGDEFADLTFEEHEEALALYAEAVSGQAQKLQALELNTHPHEDCLDKLARLLTLRKVHAVRRQELEDERPAPRSVAMQYQENERTPHLVS